jgi:hypothetical protein
MLRIGTLVRTSPLQIKKPSERSTIAQMIYVVKNLLVVVLNGSTFTAVHIFVIQLRHSVLLLSL